MYAVRQGKNQAFSDVCNAFVNGLFEIRRNHFYVYHNNLCSCKYNIQFVACDALTHTYGTQFMRRSRARQPFPL